MKTPIKLSFTTLALPPLAAFYSQEPAQPNVVLIVADDIGYVNVEWLTNLQTVKKLSVKELAERASDLPMLTAPLLPAHLLCFRLIFK